MKEFIAEVFFWPVLAWINVQDYDNEGDDRYLSGLLFVILVVGAIALAMVLVRAPEAWRIAIPVFVVAYVLMGSGHAYATRA